MPFKRQFKDKCVGSLPERICCPNSVRLVPGNFCLKSSEATHRVRIGARKKCGLLMKNDHHLYYQHYHWTITKIPLYPHVPHQPLKESPNHLKPRFPQSWSLRNVKSVIHLWSFFVIPQFTAYFGCILLMSQFMTICFCFNHPQVVSSVHLFTKWWDHTMKESLLGALSHLYKKACSSNHPSVRPSHAS